MGRKFGFSFSWKRALGISGAKQRISKKTGIPLTRSGRRRKVGRMAGCFVATAVYGNSNCVEVRFLRKFRDEVLLKNNLGRIFIWFYYMIGPHAAWLVKKVPLLKLLVLKALEPTIELIEDHSSLKRET